ncbi:MAG TPA: iron-sulfur cluster assembly accessory protein, partial [Solirubrobacteraceae bacterium]|nr:iron-sulfur cluster assembly accessory protein [Solirubrobacteraceae bacterium]
MITITDKGAEKVHEFLDAQQADVNLAGLRVGVRGGGCSGFQYQLAFDEQRDSDVVFETHGLKLLVDNESLPFVRGSVIDYQESLQG